MRYIAFINCNIAIYLSIPVYDISVKKLQEILAFSVFLARLFGHFVFGFLVSSMAFVMRLGGSLWEGYFAFRGKRSFR